MRGTMIVPKVAVSASEDPEIPPKIMLPVTVAAPRPPFIQPTSEVVKSIRLRPIDPRSIRLPARMKSGTASRMNDVEASLNICGMISMFGTG